MHSACGNIDSVPWAAAADNAVVDEVQPELTFYYVKANVVVMLMGLGHAWRIILRFGRKAGVAEFGQSLGLTDLVSPSDGDRHLHAPHSRTVN
jgi:hypothetical protein